MKYKISEEQIIDMGEMDNSFFLIGLLNEFMNRYQVVADSFFEEMSWKQCFLIICIQFFTTPPTLKELAEVVGSSHQNVKQMLLKLEKQGFVMLIADEHDKRKQRILLTQKAMEFSQKNDEGSKMVMNQIFSTVDPEKLKITIQTIQQIDEQLKKLKLK